MVHLSTEIKNRVDIGKEQNFLCHWYLDPKTGIMDHSKMIVEGKLVVLNDIQIFIQNTTSNLQKAMENLAPNFSYKACFTQHILSDDLKDKTLGYSLQG